MQQNSRKLLMMDILMSKTCWAHKKWNKITSDIKLVLYSSTITMMHGPINIRLKNAKMYLRSIHSNLDVHRAVHRNIIPIAKPTICTIVSNLCYFGMILYMFRTVFPSIIRSSRLYIQQYLFDKCLLLYVQSGTLDDVRERPSETCRMLFQNKISLIHWCILMYGWPCIVVQCG